MTEIEKEEFIRLSKIIDKTFFQEREYEYLKEEYLKEIKSNLDKIEG